jgi:hypothetical protein
MKPMKSATILSETPGCFVFVVPFGDSGTQIFSDGIFPDPNGGGH